MMLHKIFQRIITRLRRLQSQIGLGHRAQRRDQHRAGRPFGSSQNRLEKLKCSFAMIELRLEPALEEALFFFVREGRGSRFVENAPRPRGVSFLEH